MSEAIGKKIVELVSPIVPIWLSEAETEEYPYAVYKQTVQEHRTKDGVYKYTAEPELHVYAKDFDQADAIAEQIKAAIAEGLAEPFTGALRTQDKDCTAGVWDIELLYFVKQNNHD